MIAVCDVNTIWRHRPFSAMAELTEVLAFTPGDYRAVRRRVAHPETALPVVDVRLPPGWASKTAALGQRLLWRMPARRARSLMDGFGVCDSTKSFSDKVCHCLEKSRPAGRVRTSHGMIEPNIG